MRRTQTSEDAHDQTPNAAAREAGEPRRVSSRVAARMVPIALVLCAALAAGTAMFLRRYRAEASDADRFASLHGDHARLEPLWSLPPFQLRDQHDRPLGLEALRGRPFIADFIFTQCTSVCPTLTSNMLLVRDRLHDRDVQFVSFSVDPAHDTPAVLSDYAARWGALDDDWMLLSSSSAQLSEVLAGFRVAARPTNDPSEPIVHTNLFFLVDDTGTVRGIYHSDMTSDLDALVEDARALAAPRVGSDPAPRTIASLGCTGCHASPAIAPPLGAALGDARTTEDGRRVTVDAAYLRRALLDPRADVVAGYPGVMPSYAGVLSDADIDELIEQLLSTTDAAPPATPATLAMDPVCGMKVRITPDAHHARHDGEDLYFCAEACKDAFLAAPAQYERHRQ